MGASSCLVAAAASTLDASTGRLAGGSTRTGNPAGISGRVTGIRGAARSTSDGIGAAGPALPAPTLRSVDPFRPARGRSATGSGRWASCSAFSRQRSGARPVERELLGGPPGAGIRRARLGMGSKLIVGARLGIGRSMTGACGCERRFAVAGVDDRRDGSSRNAKRAPHAGQVIPVVPATENRAAHLGQMIVIAKSPPGLDYITRVPAKTGDGTLPTQPGALPLGRRFPFPLALGRRGEDQRRGGGSVHHA